MDRASYVREYYESSYGNCGPVVDGETKIVGDILLEHAYGKVIDFGCGPSLYYWALFMKNARQVDGLDIAPESIQFLEEYRHSISLTKYRGVESYVQKMTRDRRYCLEAQMDKIGSVFVADFTTDLSFLDEDYDTVFAPYSIGCVKSIEHYVAAVRNMSRHLKPGGKAIFIGTGGTTRSDILPDYCYQGVRNSIMLAHQTFSEFFRDVHTKKMNLARPSSEMFPYTELITAIGTKP